LDCTFGLSDIPMVFSFLPLGNVIIEVKQLTMRADKENFVGLSVVVGIVLKKFFGLTRVVLILRLNSLLPCRYLSLRYVHKTFFP